MKKITVILVALAFSLGSLVAKERAELEKDLQSSNDATVISAIQELAKEKEGWSRQLIISKLKHENPKVRIAASAGLGIQEDNKDELHLHLKGVVTADKDNAVVYTALLSMLNLAEEGEKNQHALAALEFVEQNKTSDQHLADAAKRMRAKITKK